MPEPAVPFADSLPETLAWALARLAEGTRDRRSPAHSPTLGTIGLDGRPRLRTVILRGFDEESRRLRFHTDRRSAKVAELARDPRVALHVYDQAGKFQMRIDGLASVHHEDAIADESWASSRAMSRVCYGTNPAPGTTIRDGGAFSVPSDEETEGGRVNFAAVVVTMERLETLYLAFSGHRRAAFRFVGEPSATWLVP
jgi:hypothetical protein